MSPRKLVDPARLAVEIVLVLAEMTRGGPATTHLGSPHAMAMAPSPTPLPTAPSPTAPMLHAV